MTTFVKKRQILNTMIVSVQLLTGGRRGGGWLVAKTHRKQEYKRAVDARGSNTSVPSLCLGAEGSNGGIGD